MGPKLVEYLKYEAEDTGIAWITFNRPERRNALMGNSQENSTVAKVGEYMRAADDDPEVRVIVITGEGQGFCSGADMRRDNDPSVLGENFVGNRDHTESPDFIRQHFFHGFTQLHRDISLIRKPTIAMINGAAVGSGMDMALHCDIRVGCENTQFVGYHQLGQIFENGGSYYLPKMAGLGRALGDRIMQVPPMVQWVSKRIMRTAADTTLENTMVLTSNAGGILGGSEDADEARLAFLEKRAPVFKGR